MSLMIAHKEEKVNKKMLLFYIFVKKCQYGLHNKKCKPDVSQNVSR